MSKYSIEQAQHLISVRGGELPCFVLRQTEGGLYRVVIFDKEGTPRKMRYAEEDRVRPMPKGWSVS